MSTESWEPSSLLVCATDGVATSVSPCNHAGLARRDATLIAATLLRDGLRGTDDATVLVVKDLRAWRQPPLAEAH